MTKVEIAKLYNTTPDCIHQWISKGLFKPEDALNLEYTVLTGTYYNQKDFAREIGVTPATVIRWHKELGLPDLKHPVTGGRIYTKEHLDLVLPPPGHLTEEDFKTREGITRVALLKLVATGLVQTHQNKITGKITYKTKEPESEEFF